MKTYSQDLPRERSSKRLVKSNHVRLGFTIVELMISLAIFSLVIIGSIYCHLMGLKMSTVTQAKLNATHTARAALNRTRDEIRSAALLYVGTGDQNGFTNILQNGLRQGNALQICPTADTNNYIRYYLDGTDKTLKRIISGGANPETIANYITNQIGFAAEDFAGNVLTNDQNNRVIRMSLEFSQWEFAVLSANGGSLYDYYRVQTRTARRALQ
jgi:prepilin-type N-terminal cleavage/methylation domain-containing protein